MGQFGKNLAALVYGTGWNPFSKANSGTNFYFFKDYFKNDSKGGSKRDGSIPYGRVYPVPKGKRPSKWHIVDSTHLSDN